MKKFALVLVVTTLAMFAYADNLKDVATKSNELVAASMKKMDFKAFESTVKSYAAIGFFYTETGKSMNLKMMLDMTKPSYAMMKSVKSASNAITNITEKNGNGYVTVKHLSEFTVNGPDKKPHVMTMDGESIQRWVKVKGTWKLLHMDMKTSKMTMDGKPFTG